MKRIKLFEAFSNGDKIEKLNHLLLCWCVKQFIKDEQLRPAKYLDYFTKRSSGLLLYSTERKDKDYVSSCNYFKYNSRYDEVDIYCLSDLKQFFIDKSITSSIVTFNETAIQKAAKQVIKKMYEDEKNKTI